MDRETVKKKRRQYQRYLREILHESHKYYDLPKEVRNAIENEQQNSEDGNNKGLIIPVLN